MRRWVDGAMGRCGDGAIGGWTQRLYNHNIALEYCISVRLTVSDMGRWGDGAMPRWGDGAMKDGRWGDGAMSGGAMGQWGDGAMGRWGGERGGDGVMG